MSDAPKTRPGDPANGSGEAAWDAYWRDGGAPGHALTDSSKAGVLDRFWTDALTAAFAASPVRRAADLACGSGAVASLVASVATRTGCAAPMLCCVDWSAAAATTAAGRLGGAARPLSADLAALPFADGGLDLVVSQYGLEYAGEPAFREAARVLAPGGALIALVHDADGGVAAECRATRALFEEASEIALTNLARAVFAAGDQADHAPRSAPALAEAMRRLQPGLARFAGLVARDNDTLAMQFLRQVRRDLLIMLARRRAYAPQDVFDWLAKIEKEITGYRDRMASMIEAARSASQIEEIAAIFSAAGYAVESPQRVLAEPAATSIGWALRVRRPVTVGPAG